MILPILLKDLNNWKEKKTMYEEDDWLQDGYCHTERTEREA